MKRVAIPVVNDKLSEYFGQCNHYVIFDIDKNKIINKKIVVPPDKHISSIPKWAAENYITDIITYKIEKKIISLFCKNKVNLFVGVPINTPQILIEEYLCGRLSSDENIIYEITT